MNNKKTSLDDLNILDANGKIDSASRKSILSENKNLVYIDPAIDNPNVGRFTKYIKHLDDGRVLVEHFGCEWMIQTKWITFS